MTVLWNTLLFLYLLLLAPKLFLQRLRGRKHPALFQRLALSLPPLPQPLLWIHAVSVGEAKAADPLYKALKIRFPTATFLITTTTATGLEEAKRSLPGAGAYLYHPLDFSWTVRRWVRHFRPQHLFLIEGDLWPNLLHTLHHSGCQNHLVSAKLSLRSHSRLSQIPRLAKYLFAPLHHICAQNETYAARLAPFHPRITLTGNLKFDQTPSPTPSTLPFFSTPPITLASTHAPEEELLLDVLAPLDIPLILAPRHPERIPQILALLQRKNISHVLWSERHSYTNQTILLIDQLGQLAPCYAASRLAILGGSFIPHIGGHNIFEPSLYGTPVFFGPHMEAQAELVHHILTHGAGRQLTLPELRSAVHADLTSYKAATTPLVHKLGGATQRTLSAIFDKNCS